MDRLRFLRREMRLLASRTGLTVATGALLASWLGCGRAGDSAFQPATRLYGGGSRDTSPQRVTADAGPKASAVSPLVRPKVWMVEHSATLESYSNGLRMDPTFAETNRPRVRYPVFPLTGGASPARYGTRRSGSSITPRKAIWRILKRPRRAAEATGPESS